MAPERCGAPTKDGGRCHYDKGDCPWHRDGRALKPPKAVEDRDLRGLGWWTIEHTIRGDLVANRGTVISTIMRTLATMGPEPLAEEEALREVELRGRLMNGLPPATTEEWELATRIFDDEALAEFRRWAALDRGPEGAAN